MRHVICDFAIKSFVQLKPIINYSQATLWLFGEYFYLLFRNPQMACILLIGFGVALELDVTMRSVYMNYAYSWLLFNGHRYNDIICAMVVTMITIGCITIVVNVFGMTDIHEKWKSKLKTTVVCIRIDLQIISV